MCTFFKTFFSAALCLLSVNAFADDPIATINNDSGCYIQWYKNHIPLGTTAPGQFGDPIIPSQVCGQSSSCELELSVDHNGQYLMIASAVIDMSAHQIVSFTSYPVKDFTAQFQNWSVIFIDGITDPCTQSYKHK